VVEILPSVSLAPLCEPFLFLLKYCILAIKEKPCPIKTMPANAPMAVHAMGTVKLVRNTTGKPARAQTAERPVMRMIRKSN